MLPEHTAGEVDSEVSRQLGKLFPSLREPPSPEQLAEGRAILRRFEEVVRSHPETFRAPGRIPTAVDALSKFLAEKGLLLSDFGWRHEIFFGIEVRNGLNPHLN